MYGITIGDASGVGPEILLKAFANGEIRWPFIAYGDIEALRFYNERLGYGVALREGGYQPGVLNVAKSGHSPDGRRDAWKIESQGRISRRESTSYRRPRRR